MDSVILGTEVKYALDVVCEGFDIEEDNFVVYIMKGHNIVKEYSKSQLELSDDDVYLICVDTAELGTGNFDVAVKAEVHDMNFGDGYRTEIAREPLFNVRKL